MTNDFYLRGIISIYLWVFNYFEDIFKQFLNSKSKCFIFKQNYFSCLLSARSTKFIKKCKNN